jgi:hypothetical protein
MKQKVALPSKKGMESSRELALMDRVVTTMFPAPPLKGRIRVLVSPEKALFFCRPERYESLCKMLIEHFPKSKIERIGN